MTGYFANVLWGLAGFFRDERLFLAYRKHLSLSGKSRLILLRSHVCDKCVGRGSGTADRLVRALEHEDYRDSFHSRSKNRRCDEAWHGQYGDLVVRHLFLLGLGILPGCKKRSCFFVLVSTFRTCSDASFWPALRSSTRHHCSEFGGAPRLKTSAIAATMRTYFDSRSLRVRTKTRRHRCSALYLQKDVISLDFVSTVVHVCAFQAPR